MDESQIGAESTKLDDIIAEYIFAEEAGEAVSREELLKKHPELSGELNEFFADRDRFKRLASPLSDETSRGNDLPATVRYFGDYELLEEVAAGGMGVVYKARQTSLNRIVAVKMIRAGHLASDEDIRRFKEEARTAANLKHKAIVPIYEVGQQSGQHYFSMEFIEGENLADLIRTDPPSCDKAARIIKTIASAIDYAHQQGTIHRDLKPSNILIDEFEQVHITDFGLAMRVEGDSELTQTGQIMGTACYMPPEQARGDRKLIGPASDIYSLGAVLYELLTARPPFRGDAAAATLQQLLDSEPLPPTRLDRKVPADLETICLKCLEKEPHKRYSDASLLADDLGRFLVGAPILGPVSRGERAWRWCKRNPVVASLSAATSLLLVIIAVGTTLGFLRAEGDRKELERSFAELKTEQKLSSKLSTEIADKEKHLGRLNKSFQDVQVKLDAGEEKQYEIFMQLARRAWEVGDVELADYYLNQCPSRFRDPDPAWRHLKRQCYPPVEKFDGRRCVAISPDGLFIASGSADGKVKVWEIESRCELHVFDGPEGGVNAVRFSADGQLLAGGGGRQAVLWDLQRGDVARKLEGHTYKVTDVDFSPDGKRLASASFDPESRGRKGGVIVWNLDTYQQERTFPDARYAVFSHDGRYLAAASKVWDLSKSTGATEPARLAIHSNCRPAFHPKQNVLAIIAEGSWPEVVELRRIPSWDLVQRLPVARGWSTNCLAFSRDAKRLVFGRTSENEYALAPEEYRTVIWNLVTQEVERVLPWHLNTVTETAFRSGHPKLATGEKDVIKLWDITAPHNPTQEILDSIAAMLVGKWDWPQWGGSWSRMNTPYGKNIPSDWDTGTRDRKTNKWVGSKNIKWVANLGSQTYGNPVVANGKIFVGTNNGNGYVKRYPFQIDLGVLLCFDEATGKFLWQHSNEKLPTGRVHDWELQGVCSTPLVDGDRLWYVSNRGEVVCLDTEGYYDGEDDGPVENEPARVFNVPSGIYEDKSEEELIPTLNSLAAGNLSDYARAQFARVGFKLPVDLEIKAGDKPNTWSFGAKIEDRERNFFVRKEGPTLAFYTFTTPDDKHEADIVWKFNMMTELGVSQHNMANCSVLTADGMLFVCTSNGMDESHKNIPAPTAPSFMAMDRETGKVIWTDNSPGKNILHAQWASPSYGVFDGQPQVIFPGGDGWVYSFDPKGDGKGGSKLLWTFDANPKDSKWVLGGRGTRNSIIAFPAIYDGLVYIAVGQDPEHGEGVGHLWCIDPAKHTDGSDISPELALDRNGNVVRHWRVQAVLARRRKYCYDPSLADGLDQGTVSEALRDQIISLGIDLPQELTIETVKEASSWIITSTVDKSLLIRINVYSRKGTIAGVVMEWESGERAIPNPKSAVVWHYSQRDRNGDGKFSFEETFHRSLSIPVIKDNILYTPDFSGLFHCLNAKTGEVYWTYDMFAQCYGSALLVDDKVYIGDEDGDVTIFAHTVSSRPMLKARATQNGRIEYFPSGDSREGQPIAEINMGSYVYMTPIVANNVLYIASRSHLFAIAHDEP